MFYSNEKHSQSSEVFQDSSGLKITICTSEANHLLLYR